MTATALPAGITSKQFSKQYGWSDRRVRALAKKLGACCILGNRMTLLPDHVEAILEYTKCPSSSTVVAGSSTTAARLPGGTYADLVKQRTKTSRRERPPKSSPIGGNVISMDRNQS
jgi:hypothetical protein